MRGDNLSLPFPLARESFIKRIWSGVVVQLIKEQPPPPPPWKLRVL